VHPFQYSSHDDTATETDYLALRRYDAARTVHETGSRAAIERCANGTSALPGLKVPFMPSADVVILSADEKRVVLEVCLTLQNPLGR
jgi:hypothetical protein